MMRFLIPVLAVLMLSCFEKGDCSDVSSNVMQLKFYKYSDKKALTITLDSIKMVGWDTVMYKAKSLDTIVLPINPDETTMTYIFYYNNVQAILKIEYTLKTYALAPDCNAIDLITIKAATGTSIQELLITQPKLTNTLAENIKLYF